GNSRQGALQSDPRNWAKLNVYVDWFISQFGPIEFYELCGECDPSTEWVNYVADYIKSRDPGKLLTINWNPSNDANSRIDFFSPHFYDSTSEFDADQQLSDLINSRVSVCCGPDLSESPGPWRRFNHAILAGEGGETGGVNWYPSTPN